MKLLKLTVKLDSEKHTTQKIHLQKCLIFKRIQTIFISVASNKNVNESKINTIFRVDEKQVIHVIFKTLP